MYVGAIDFTVFSGVRNAPCWEPSWADGIDNFRCFEAEFGPKSFKITQKP